MDIKNIDYEAVRQVLNDPKNIAFLDRNRIDGILETMPPNKRSSFVEFIVKVLNTKYKIEKKLDPIQMLTGSNKILSGMYLNADIVNLSVPANIREVESNAFDQSTLKTIVFNGVLQSLHSYTFNDCPELEKVELPDGLERLEKNAFCNCPNLKVVIVPASIKDIAVDVFSNVNENIEIHFKKGIVDKWKKGEIVFYTPENKNFYVGKSKGGHGVFEDAAIKKAATNVQSQVTQTEETTEEGEQNA